MMFAMTDLLLLLRAMNDPTRLRILRLIGRMELAIGEVATLLAQSQPRISRHVRILAEAGLVDRHKEGAWVFLRPGPALLLPSVSALLNDSAFAADQKTEQDMERLGAVRAERARAAAQWFSAHAAEWDSIRSLHIPEEAVEAAILDSLGDAPLGRMLDIGTGTGRMTELLAARASHVVAVDNSPEMLRLARAKFANSGNERLADPEQVALQLGDFNALPLDDASIDFAILHQVLHFAQMPEQVVAEVARVLAPGGRVLIIDFAPHDLEELRDKHAHARLGFADDSMARWFHDGGLIPSDTRSLEGNVLSVRLWTAHKPPLPAPNI